MRYSLPRLAPLGDSALTLSYARTLDPLVQETIRDHARRLATAAPAGLVDIVPGYVALTLHFDPLQTTTAVLRDAVALALAMPPVGAASETEREVVIPVRYDGPDLAEVAERTGLEVGEVVRRHQAPEYRVALLGFVPGFAYLGPIDPALVLPRRSSPRTRVPAGSVAIAGEQTGVYPAATPGGWHLIGHTTMSMFDPDRDPPATLRVGDRVRFREER